MKTFLRISVLIYFISIEQCSTFSDAFLPLVCPNIVSRFRWGARCPLEVDYALIPIQNVIVHHTVTKQCGSESECSSLIKRIQNFHMETLEFHDISYNFLVGCDGQIYEGAGWHKVGTHTPGFNGRSLGLAFIGNFNNDLPNAKQIKAAKDFLRCGVELGELDEQYKLFGARQVKATESPGLKLFRELKRWPHFTKFPPK